MSVDITLINPANRDDRYEVGNYTNNVWRMWHAAFHRSGANAPDFDDLHGASAKVAIDDLSLATAYMLTHPEDFIPMNPDNGWGCYEGAAEYLFKFWKACWMRPTWLIDVSS